MAQKLDQVTSFVLSLDEDEIGDIIDALNEVGAHDLAGEIDAECFGKRKCCGPEIAELKFEIDTSQVEAATERLERMADAADRVARASDRLSDRGIDW